MAETKKQRIELQTQVVIRQTKAKERQKVVKF